MVYNTHPDVQYGRSTGGTLADLPETVRDAAAGIRTENLKFDLIVAQGVSGIAVAAPLAIRLRKELVVLRKENENCHDMGGSLLGKRNVKGKRVLMIDDFISQGATARRIDAAITQAGGELVGCYQYARPHEPLASPARWR